jgi:O-antigen/teichoic acid export membrane protein
VGKDSRTVETRQHIRGSSLLLAGRLFALLVNFVVQVVTVRYLSKSDYGAFAYALSVVSTCANAVLFGLNRAVSRFVPIFQEKGDHASMFGTVLVALGAVTGGGVALVVLAFGLEGVLTDFVARDPLSVGLLLILIALAPLEALDNLFQGLLAVFASPRAIFLRRHVLGPCLRLGAVLAVMALQGSVRLLAATYLIAGLLGAGAYVLLLARTLRRQGVWQRFNLRAVRLPVRQLFAFSLPLFTSDVLSVLKPTVAVLLLESFRGTTDVAEFRAVLPVAGLNLVVYQSLKLLFLPLASRLYARHDAPGLNNLYWQSALWTTVLTFPVFASCLLLSDTLTVFLFGERYAEAGLLLVVLAAGDYFNAMLGCNVYSLQVYARVRFLALTSGLAVLVALGLNLWLIPRHGALGAAVATAGSIAAQNLLNQFGLGTRTELKVFQRRPMQVYLCVILTIAALLLIRIFLSPSVPLLILTVALASGFVLFWNRRALDIAHTFPELARFLPFGKLTRAETD